MSKLIRTSATILVAAGLFAGTAGVASAAPASIAKKSSAPAEWLR